MANVFSKRFFAHQGVNGSLPTLVVPAGHVYVVKQVTFYGNPALGQMHGFFHDVGSGAALFAVAWSMGQPEWFGFFGSLVFEEGDSMNVSVSSIGTDGADAYVGGYDLVN